MSRRTIAGYRLVETLGEGGSGIVYLAEADDGSRCAIKTIRPDLIEDRRFIESLRQEASIYARLDHPGIVKVLELGEDEGQVFLRMEHIDGASLAQLFAGPRGRRRRLPAALACHVASEVARALAHAHALRDDLGRSLGIVHRDINPANIMITRSGAVKLLDFGIATAAEHVLDRRTASAPVEGTPGYLSPEQADGRRVDGRSDLFSLGVVLYEAVTGVSLFRGRNALHRLRLLADTHMTAPSRLCPELDVRLDGILQAMLAADPADRPGDGGLVVRELAPLVATDGSARLAELVAQLPAERVRSAGRWWRRAWPISASAPMGWRRWSVVAGAAVALALAALAARHLGRDSQREVAVARHADGRDARLTQAARWYQQGLARLRLEDCIGARTLLDRALAADPTNALALVARGRCWLLQGDPARAWQDATRARASTAGLDRQQQLVVAAFSHEAAGQWPAAVATYRTLVKYFPGSVDHGLALVAAMEQAGLRRHVGAVLEGLRTLPGGEDPRIDLADVGTGCGREAQLAQARLARDRARAHGAEVLAAGAELAEAWTLIRFGGCAEARPVWQSARQVFQRAGRPRELLKLDRFESRCLREEGDLHGALQIAERNLAAMRRLEDPDVTDRGLRELAESQAALGRRAEAQHHWEEALLLARSRDNYPGAALALDGLGSLRASAGDLRGAIRFEQQAIEARAPEKREDPLFLARQSTYQLEAGAPAEARDLAERALIEARLSRGPRAIEVALLATSAALRAAGRLDQARRAASEAQQLTARTWLPELAAEAHLELAEIALAEGNRDAAAEAAQALLAQLTGSARAALAGNVHELLARIELGRGQRAAARQAIDRARSAVPAGGFPFTTSARLDITQARVEAAEGELRSARARLQRTVETCRRSQHLKLAAEARAALRSTRS